LKSENLDESILIAVLLTTNEGEIAKVDYLKLLAEIFKSLSLISMNIILEFKRDVLSKMAFEEVDI